MEGEEKGIRKSDQEIREEGKREWVGDGRDIPCAVLRVHEITLARWLSWLERRPVTAEVVGSNPIRVASESRWREIISVK